MNLGGRGKARGGVPSLPATTDLPGEEEAQPGTLFSASDVPDDDDEPTDFPENILPCGPVYQPGVQEDSNAGTEVYPFPTTRQFLSGGDGFPSMRGHGEMVMHGSRTSHQNRTRTDFPGGAR
jgi:hypothetical protein